MGGAFTGNWWVYYGLLQNYPIFTPDGTCAVDPFRCGIPPAWSLAVEIAFYALLPFFALAMNRLARWREGRGWLTPELTVVALIGAVSIAIQSIRPDSDALTWLFFSPFGRGWWFGLGLALASISVWAERRAEEPAFVGWLRRSPGTPLVAAGVLYVLSCFLLPDAQIAFPLTGQLEYVTQYVLFGVIAALVLLPAIFGVDGGGRARRFLGHPVTTWLGLISYGIFLWQFPVIILLVDAGLPGVWPALDFPILTIATMVGTVLCAAVSFYALERPLMRWGRSREASADRAGRVTDNAASA